MRPDTWYIFANPAILKFLGTGLLATMALAATAIIISLALALTFGLARLSSRWYIHWPSVAYIEGIRALPVLLLIVYLGVNGSKLLQPLFGQDFELPRYWAGVLGLSLYTSAVLGEIVRAGILSLPRGQSEAALASGLSYFQAMRFVILPQALRLMVPAMMSQLTAVIKDTALISSIGVNELLMNGKILYNRYFNPVEVFLLVAIVYFVLCFPLSLASRRFELGRTVPKFKEIELRDQAA